MNNNLNNSEKLLYSYLDLIEFELKKDDNGYYLHDLQGANLGYIEQCRFNDPAELVDRITGCYLDDYIVRNLEEVCDYDYQNYDDFVRYLKEHYEEYSDYGWDIDVLELACDESLQKQINLDKVYQYANNLCA